MNYQRKTTTYIVLFAGLFAALWGLQQFYQRIAIYHVPILTYHCIGNESNSNMWVHVEDFEKQLKLLKELGYKSILPEDLVANKHWGKRLPAKSVIFTFDDGYMNNLQNAEPLLKKYGFRGIIYLVTGKIAGSAADRMQMDGAPMLTWPEVREMYKRRTFTFGGQTRSQAHLSDMSNPYPELIGCFQDIKIMGGFKPAGFCYPGGDYKPETISAVQNAGFTTAVTCKGDLLKADKNTSLFELPRLSVVEGHFPLGNNP